MPRRTTISVGIQAPLEKTFDVFERTLSSILLHGSRIDQDRDDTPYLAGEEFGLRLPHRGRMVDARCRVLARDPPSHLAWRVEQPLASLTAEFRLRESESQGSGATVAECIFELAPIGRAQQVVTRLFGRVIDRRLREHVEALRAVAEDRVQAPLDVVERDGLWRRGQRRYRGLLEACAPGVHEDAARLVLEHVPTTAAALDLGAGTGAWLARLRDAGFGKLTAVEMNVAGFELSDVVPHALDLNAAFAERFEERFDLVTAIEIIEHLDSPRAFLRQVYSLLEDDGHALVTMPNVAHWAGRLKFLLRGEHRHFGEVDYLQRHISPVTDLHMRLMFREIGFDLVASVTAGTFAGSLKRAILAPVTVLFRALLGSSAVGEVTIYLVAKGRPDGARLGADSNYNARIAQIWSQSRRIGQDERRN